MTALLAAAPALAGQNMPVREQVPTTEEVAAARGVEALFVNHMIEEMRKTVPEEDGLVPVSNAEKIYRSMLDSEYARMISESGMLGISDLVLEQMQGKR